LVQFAAYTIVYPRPQLQIPKERQVLCEILKESLEQLDNDSIVVPRNTTARLVTIQVYREAR
jgi:hypothetical protein